MMINHYPFLEPKQLQRNPYASGSQPTAPLGATDPVVPLMLPDPRTDFFPLKTLHNFGQTTMMMFEIYLFVSLSKKT
jgi:hypothetical protein